MSVGKTVVAVKIVRIITLRNSHIRNIARPRQCVEVEIINQSVIIERNKILTAPYFIVGWRFENITGVKLHVF